MVLDSIAEQVWLKGRPVEGYSEDVWRYDAANNLIRHDDYGDRNSAHGWEIDHIVPRSRGGSDRLLNLRPLHWRANVARN